MGWAAVSGVASGFANAALICALIYLLWSPGSQGWLRSVVKTSAVLGLAGAAVWAGGAGWLILALGLCALGDFCLSRPGERAFMAGVAAFAAGHLAYVVLFLRHPLSDPSRLLEGWGLLVLAGLALVGLVAMRVFVPRAQGLGPAVLAYIPVILSMGVAAATLPPALALPAALVFMLSDMMLATGRFVLSAQSRLLDYAIWSTYWIAQAGFLYAFV